MVQPPVRSLAVCIVVVLIALAAVPALAFNPQPDPPAFGIVAITELQSIHLHVALPAVQRGVQPGPCRVTLSFVNGDGQTISSTPATLMPGEAATLSFVPARVVGDGPVLTDALDIAPARHRLRAVVTYPPDPGRGTSPPDPCHGLLANVQVAGADGVPTATLAPARLEVAQFTGGVRHLFGPLAIGFGHTIRLNAANVNASQRAGSCHVFWSFVNQDGTTVALGDGSVRPGEAIFADFAHTDQSLGTQVLRAEAVAVGDVNGDGCPTNAVIGTVEGFDSTTMVTHTVQGTQILLPAVQK
jgi:hypothetical protein